MKSKIAVYGGGGHGKVVAEIIELSGSNKVYFFDEKWPVELKHEHWPLVGNLSKLIENINRYDGVIVAIGNNNTRVNIFKELKKINAPLQSFIHPLACVSRYAQIGIGSVIMAHSVINPFVTIGDAVIVNTAATIDHDSVVSDGSHVCPGVHLSGAVKVGYSVMIGVGAQVVQCVNIGDGAVVGAGANVISDVEPNTIVVGNPAKLIQKKGLDCA